MMNRRYFLVLVLFGFLVPASLVNAQGLGPGMLDLGNPVVKKAAGTHIVTDGAGQMQLGFRNKTPGAADGIAISLDATVWAGNWLTLSAWVKGENISKKPQPWNGVKVMLKMVGKTSQWPQLVLPVGSFDWQKGRARVHIPADCTELTLILGLEAVTGAAVMKEISLGFAALDTPPPAVDPSKPVFTGHGPGALRGAMIRPDLSRADFDVLTKDWKANLIRWQLIRGVGQKTDPASWNAWLETMLVKLDTALVWAREQGTMVVLDLHSPPGGGDSIGGYQDASGALFTDPVAQDRFVAAWELMARRYKGNSTIWSFDLANEPDDSSVQEPCLDWQGLALRAARAIRAIDPRRVIMVQPAGMGNPAAFERFRPLPLEEVVYSIHWYEPGAFTHQGVFAQGPVVSYPGMIDGKMWNRATLAEGLKPALDFAQRYRVHIYVGEFGAVRWAPGNERYLADLVSLFEEYGWDWSFHAFREWHGWSIEHDAKRSNEARTGTKSARARAILDGFARNKTQGSSWP